MESCGMTLTDKEIHDLGAEIDKDGSGVFEFSEFVELVKVLLLRLRQAQEASETVEDMEEVLGELEQELKAKNMEAKRLANTVFEMRKGGAHVNPQPSTLRDVTCHRTCPMTRHNMTHIVNIDLRLSISWSRASWTWSSDSTRYLKRWLQFENKWRTRVRCREGRYLRTRTLFKFAFHARLFFDRHGMSSGAGKSQGHDDQASTARCT